MHIALRPSQAEAYAALRKERLAILNAPTGWGKSLVLTAMMGHKLAKQRKAKVIIAIPQLTVAKGFAKNTDIRLPDGGNVSWEVCRDLSTAQEDKVDKLCNFLAGKTDERVIVVSHATIRHAWGKCRIADATNVTLVVDEAHHCESENMIGTIVGEAIDVGCSVVLATAYWFRGDRASILPAKIEQRFARHHVDFAKHWDSLKFLKSYSYDLFHTG